MRKAFLSGFAEGSKRTRLDSFGTLHGTLHEVLSELRSLNLEEEERPSVPTEVVSRETRSYPPPKNPW